MERTKKFLEYMLINHFSLISPTRWVFYVFVFRTIDLLFLNGDTNGIALFPKPTTEKLLLAHGDVMLYAMMITIIIHPILWHIRAKRLERDE